MFLPIHFEIQVLAVIITTNTRTQPENFQEILQISRRFPGEKSNSSKFPEC